MKNMDRLNMTRQHPLSVVVPLGWWSLAVLLMLPVFVLDYATLGWMVVMPLAAVFPVVVGMLGFSRAPANAAPRIEDEDIAEFADQREAANSADWMEALPRRGYP